MATPNMKKDGIRVTMAIKMPSIAIVVPFSQKVLERMLALTRTRLYILLIGVMVIWGLNVIAVKFIVDQFAPVTITSLRIFTASLTLMPLLMARRLWRKLTRREMMYLFTISLTGILGHHFFLSVGLANTTSANGGLILGTIPIATSILAAVMLGERLSPFRIGGLLSGFAGVVLIVLAQQTGSWHLSMGDLFVFFAVVAQAISFVLVKKATATLEAAYVTGMSQLIGSFLLFLLALQLEPHGMASLTQGTLLAWSVFLASGVLATGLGHLLYNTAIHQVGTAEAAIFLNLTPLFSLLGAVWFLGEPLHPEHLVSFLFIAAGVFLGTGMVDESMHRRRMKRQAEKRLAQECQSLEQ